MSEDSEEKSHVDAAMLLQKFRNSMPLFLEMATLQSRLVRARYNALLDAGFTEAQALELCTKDVRI